VNARSLALAAIGGLLQACAAQAPPPATVSLVEPLPSAPPSPVPPPPPRERARDAADFTSERGIVHLAAQGDGSLAGTFGGSGVMTCTRSADAVSCRWYDGAADGSAAFHRRPDGRLEGTFGNGTSADDAGAWTLVPVAARDDGLGGVWDTNWGPAVVHATAGGIHVDYRDGTMDCEEHDAGKLTCAWTEGSTTGKAELTIESRRVLRGRWGNGGSATDGGGWLFVRR
jgi:hypothetical protein